MNRTTIVLPEDLRYQAQQIAHRMRISFAELIRKALREKINRTQDKTLENSFFKDTDFFKGKTPSDLSENHDDYLY